MKMTVADNIMSLVDHDAGIGAHDLDFFIRVENGLSADEGWVLDGTDRVLAIASVPGSRGKQALVLFGDDKMQPTNADILAGSFEQVKAELAARGVRLEEPASPRGPKYAVRAGYKLDTLK